MVAPDDDDDQTLIDCDEHGRSTGAVVCRHHLDSAVPVGFIENSSEPDDLQGWCFACEQRFLEEGELNEAFRAFNDFGVVCLQCYEKLKRRHTAAMA